MKAPIKYTLIVLYVLAAYLCAFWLGREYQKDREETRSFQEGYKKGFKHGSRNAGPVQELFHKILRQEKK